MAVNFTPGQLRDSVGIGQETFRHWKKVLVPLRRRVGHSPCFTVGDLLATSVIRTLVADFGIRVSALTPVASAIYMECNESSWPALERSLLVVDIARETAFVRQEGSGLTLDRAAMVIPLRFLIDALRGTLLAGGSDAQEMLRFPPTAQPTAAERKAGQS